MAAWSALATAKVQIGLRFFPRGPRDAKSGTFAATVTPAVAHPGSGPRFLPGSREEGELGIGVGGGVCHLLIHCILRHGMEPPSTPTMGLIESVIKYEHNKHLLSAYCVLRAGDTETVH